MSAAVKWEADPIYVLADGSRVLCLKLPRNDATPETDYQKADAMARKILPFARLYAKGDSDGTVRRLYHSPRNADRDSYRGHSPVRFATESA